MMSQSFAHLAATRRNLPLHASMAILAFLGSCLRTLDNPALYYSIQQVKQDPSTGPVIAFYIEDPTQRLPGAAFTWWTRKSLPKLRHQLDRLRVPLLCLRSSYPHLAEVLVKVDNPIHTVHVNRRWGGTTGAEDARFKQILAEVNIAHHEYTAHTLHEPWEIKTGQGQPYRVYTAFSRHFAKIVPRLLDEPPVAPNSDDTAKVVNNILIMFHTDHHAQCLDWSSPESEHNPTWASEFPWIPGSETAHHILTEFLKTKVSRYSESRDIPFESGTSQLSPYLAHGEISPHRVLHALREVRSNRDTPKPAIESSKTFERELVWREFNYHLLYHQPDLATQNHNEQWNLFTWSQMATESQLTEFSRTGELPPSTDEQDALNTAAAYDCWRAGHTGFPIVDAGMRQLWKIGWMHNRVRMITASLLIKNLRIHWRLGEEWFWNTLVDADPASNPGNWQWVAGTGADAAPFFRIFNPARQADRFDQKCAYVRTWVPELKTKTTQEIAAMYEVSPRKAAKEQDEDFLALTNPSLSSQWIHSSPNSSSTSNSVKYATPFSHAFSQRYVAVPETNYHNLIVDFKKSRDLALSCYQTIRKNSESSLSSDTMPRKKIKTTK